MKHRFLLLFALIFFDLYSKTSAQSNIFNYIDFSLNSTLQFPKNDEKNEDSIKGNAGIKISLKNADIRLYESLSKINIESFFYDLKNQYKDYNFFEDARYGIGISLFDDFIPISIKLGKNTFSSSLSKIKNPTPSFTTNPLKKSFSFSSGLGASLPTLSTGTKIFSSAISFDFSKNIQNIPITTDFFIDEDFNSAFSIYSKLNLSKKSSINIAISGARFFIENNSQVLKKTNADFNANFFYTGLAEISFRTPILKTNIFSGFQESPYKSNSLWYKIDGRTSFKNFLIDISYFSIPTANTNPKTAPLISADSSIVRTLEQFSINPQIIFLFDYKNNSSIRLGLSGIENLRITSTKDANQLKVGTIKASSLFENNFLLFQYDFANGNILISGESKTKSTTPEKYYSNKISTNVSNNFFQSHSEIEYKIIPPYNSKYKEKEELNTKINFSISNIKSIIISNSLSLIFEEDNFQKGDFISSISYKLKNKRFHSNIRCSFEIPFKK